MHKITLATIVTLLVSYMPAAHAQVDEAIVAAEKSWAKAVVAMDLVALAEIYSDDLIYAHSTGTIETKKEYLEKLKLGTQKYVLVEHQSTTTKTFGNAAIAHSMVRMKGVSPKEPFDSKLMMIHVWVMQGGKWRLVAHQTTKLMDY